jgi:uncharacterized protein with NRDE domain
MCLIAFAWQRHPRWRLLLAGNRDEFHERPTAPLHRWGGARPFAAGRDLAAGGTWLGAAADGRCAAVTNVRDPHAPHEGQSRGLLALDYLRGQLDASAYGHALMASASAYRPFNLLLFDAGQAFYLGNRPEPRMQRVEPGVHGLSNADFNAPWPKTRRLAAVLEAWLAAGGDEDFSPLFEALADERRAADGELPDTGIGLERERVLSAAFIRDGRYGTRASTVVALDHVGGGWVVERGFGVDGVFLGETRLAL